MDRPTRTKGPNQTTATPKSRRNPGVAILKEVADHLRVDRDTAKALLKEKKIRDRGIRATPTYAWRDIWKITGVRDADAVEPQNWPALKAPLLTTAEVATGDRLNIDESTVRRYANEGRLPGIQVGKRPLWRFRQTDIDAYLAAADPDPETAT